MIDEPTLPHVEYRYWACDLRTGNKLAQLPLKPSGALTERIGSVSTVGFSCDQYAVLKDGGDFIGTTVPGRTLIVVEREYEGETTSDIVWAGVILPRKAGSAPTAQFNCSTVAAYLDARYVGTHTYNGGPGETDSQIITDLMADAAPEGLDFILDINCPTLRSVRYRETDRKTVLAALQELSAMDGGPEWTIKARWSDASRTSVDLVFVARTELGSGSEPDVRFDYPGSINSYDVDDDFTKGHGANHIIGVNSNGAGSTPARDEQALAEGYPRWEEAISAQGDLNAAGLAGVAAEGIKWKARGQIANELDVSLTYGPQYGRDFVLGDRATWTVAAPLPGEDPPSPRHPQGHQEVLRVIGIGLNIEGDSYQPVLWNPYGEAS